MRRLASFVLLTGIGIGAAACPLLPFDVPDPCGAIQCNDGNPCTEDLCNTRTGACVFDPLPAGVDCDDGNLCNGIDTCNTSGTCRQAQGPVAVDDDDACTDDSCDPDTGFVSHDPIAGCGAGGSGGAGGGPPVVTVGWQTLATSGAPEARYLHSMVWTGSQMIVWGGRLKSSTPPVTDSGAIYDPATDSWSAMTTTGAPEARHSHSAVWTGTKMVVWGGFGTSDYLTDGAAYDPSSDSWTPISNSGAPGGRTMHSTVWTGSQMIVFGGLNGVDAIKTGGRYDPSGDSWTPTSAIAAPFARFSHAAVWTGSQMIIWGGTNTFDWLDHGRVYDPAGDTWGADTSTTNVPFIRESTIAEWSGSEMLIWGGWDGGNYLQSGASLDPTNGSGGSWTTISESGAPSGRARHVSAWTGSQLFVWGGCAGQVCDTVREDGGIWQPGNGGGSWSAVPADANFPGRHEARSVWTGSEVIVWGGRRGNTYLDDGARADLSTF